MKLTLTTLSAADAHPGDVVLAPDGNVYQAPPDKNLTWSSMQPIGSYGNPEDTTPDGDLVLLVRNGVPRQA